MMDLQRLAWPQERLGEVIAWLARLTGLDPRDAQIGSAEDLEGGALVDWVEGAAATLGIAAEHMVSSYAEFEALVASMRPGLLRLVTDDGVLFLAVLPEGSSSQPSRTIRLLSRSGEQVLASVEEVFEAYSRVRLGPLREELGSMLEAAGVAQAKRPRVLDALLRERLGNAPFAACFQLGPSPHAPFRDQITEAGLFRTTALLLVNHALQYALLVGAWWVLGKGALEGRFDRGWLFGWGLMLVSMVPLRMIETWLQGKLAIGGGRVLKRRLLTGVLRLDSNKLRSDGAGRLLGRVIESEQVETLALGGGALALLSVVELVVAGGVLALGAGGALHVSLLVVWTAVSFWIAKRYFESLRAWTHARLDMTHSLVEKMVGHRTRLGQLPRGRWHDDEDRELANYIELSGKMDWYEGVPLTIFARAWLIVGFLGMTPAFVFGDGQAGQAGLAVALGGVLLAYRAFHSVSIGIGQLAAAIVSWTQASDVFEAADQGPVVGDPSVALAAARSSSTVIEALDVSFRYEGRGESVLAGCDLTIHTGDRLLLEGSSGTGKSTLAALLTGLKSPQTGLILAGGFDLATLGEVGWRGRVAMTPQFHENHILAGTLSFNLLMGRSWPPEWKDLQEAQEVCEDLGLGPLLAKMPGGLEQVVGDGGWQLSHGEQSRVFLARALLQNASLVVIDESFAALDPETLDRCLSTAFERAETMLVIAHP